MVLQQLGARSYHLYLEYKARKTDLDNMRDVMPFVTYAKTSKMAEMIVLAWQDTSTRKGRDESTDMPTQTHVYCPLLHSGNNILQLHTATTI